ncbi:hypothetical protein GCM10028857_02450 [Salinarchaeum chitinilyticum]
MDKGMKIGVACLLIGVLALGATIPFSTESYRVHDTSVELPDDEGHSPRTDSSYVVVQYERLSADGRDIYHDALEGDGTTTREPGEGVSRWPYDESVAVVIDREGVESLPPADEADPGSRYDAMAVDTRSEEPPVGGDVVPFLLNAIGIVGVLLGVAIGFFSE